MDQPLTQKEKGDLESGPCMGSISLPQAWGTLVLTQGEVATSPTLVPVAHLWEQLGRLGGRDQQGSEGSRDEKEVESERQGDGEGRGKSKMGQGHREERVPPLSSSTAVSLLVTEEGVGPNGLQGLAAIESLWDSPECREGREKMRAASQTQAQIQVLPASSSGRGAQGHKGSGDAEVLEEGG